MKIVRYKVNYGDRKYGYVLHKNRSLELRNLADLLNVVEYCVVQDLKAGNTDIPRIEVVRYIDNVEDGEWDQETFIGAILDFINQMLFDFKTRNSEGDAQ